MPSAQLPLRSIAGYPKHFSSSTRYDKKTLLMEDGDLAIEDGDLALVGGAVAVGQQLVFSLSTRFADHFDGFLDRIMLQGAPKPTLSLKRRAELGRDLHTDALWQMENEPKTRTFDPRGLSIPEMIESALGEASEHLKCVLDVRFNGHDIEIDYEPAGYDTHVLRADGLIPRAGAQFRWKRALPVDRGVLLRVEDLTHQLLAHAKLDPGLLRSIHWRTFERLIAELLESIGWEVLELTRASKDGGVDIFAALPSSAGSVLAAIDCKKYENDIGVEKVRAVAGLKLQHGTNLGMLVTTSYFTRGARDLEHNELRNHVQLHDFDRIKEWLALHKWKSAAGLYLPRSRFSSDGDSTE